MADLIKIEEDKTDSMLSNKLLTILIENESMEIFMEGATLKVSIFLSNYTDNGFIMKKKS